MDQELVYQWTIQVIANYIKNYPDKLVTVELIRLIHDEIVTDYDRLLASSIAWKQERDTK